MIFEGRYFDEILRNLYNELIQSTDTFEASKGKGQDLLAPKVILKNPRSRISATANRGRLISALGEFCWYMRGAADLESIRFYLRDYPPKHKTGSLEEAYGPRLIGTGEFAYSVNQISRVTERLKQKPDTRRAVISIIESSDLSDARSEAPCTVALQFIRRRDRLHAVSMMRSNDAFLGFPHDVFSFTLIQELIARSLGIQLGEYHHFATSLHLYERDRSNIDKYLSEGYQNPTFEMPKMPSGCQNENLKRFLEVEEKIRNEKIYRHNQIKLPEYWKDLSLIILRHADAKFKRGLTNLDENFSHISQNFYRSFFVKKPSMIRQVPTEELKQDRLDLGDLNDE